MGYQTIRGVSADTVPLGVIPHAALEAYDSVEVGDVTTDVPEICPPILLTEVESKLVEAFAERLAEVFPGGGKSLVVDAVCRYYKKKSRIGSEGRLDLLVTLRDSATSQSVGRFFVEGISESPLHTGMDDMAKGTAKEVAKHLKKLKEPDDEEKEADAADEPSGQPVEPGAASQEAAN